MATITKMIVTPPVAAVEVVNLTLSLDEGRALVSALGCYYLTDVSQLLHKLWDELDDLVGGDANVSKAARADMQQRYGR